MNLRKSPQAKFKQPEEDKRQNKDVIENQK